MKGSFFRRHIRNRFDCISLIAILSLSAIGLSSTATFVAAQEVAAIPKSQFQARDATRYKENPNLAPYGLKNIIVAYQGSLWPSGASTSQPNLTYVTRYARKIRSQRPDVVILDLEFWKFPSGMTSSQITAQITKYKKVIGVFRRELPNTKIGIYMVLPERNWLAPCGDPKKRASRTSSWHKRNLKLRPLADAVDIIVPSLYAFYSDSKSVACWTTYAKANIAEARIYGKPVWAFLWMKYKSGGAWIASSFWRKQLETSYTYADGLVIWSMARATDRWSWSAPWWRQTKDFLADRNLD